MSKAIMAGPLKWVVVIALTAIVSSAATWAVASSIMPTSPPKPEAPTEYAKAAWIYVGPVGDYGWTHAHDVGRRYVAELFPWLETHGVESVSEADCPSVIDDLVASGYNVIFTTSFGFMDATIDAGKKYPDVIFFHCSGYKRWSNVGTYFAEFYQLYYLNGLMAGALTNTGKAGYVAAHPIPEVIRHINAFAIGFAEVAQQRYERGELPNPPEVHVVWIHAWYDPTKARQAAEAFRNRPQLLEMMLIIMVRVSASSGSLHPEEDRLMRETAATFGFRPGAYESLKMRYGAGTGGGAGSSGYKLHFGGNRSRGR